jgi:PTS system nitrogen regulatory IIA component
MSDFSDIITPGSVVAGLPITTKKQLFQQLAALAEKNGGVEARTVVERLSERERLGSTGFGGGVAIPHGKIERLDRVIGVFARLDEPIDFQAIDDMPVDIVFMLLSPPDAGAEHLKALARVSRALRDRPFLAKLRGAGSDDALYALLASGEARDAA